jgi:hypothetical protein
LSAFLSRVIAGWLMPATKTGDETGVVSRTAAVCRCGPTLRVCLLIADASPVDRITVVGHLRNQFRSFSMLYFFGKIFDIYLYLQLDDGSLLICIDLCRKCDHVPSKDPHETLAAR